MGEREELLDRVVQFDGCSSAEPTLRQMICAYYARGLGPDAALAKMCAEKFIEGLGAPAQATLSSGDLVERIYQHISDSSTADFYNISEQGLRNLAAMAASQFCAPEAADAGAVAWQWRNEQFGWQDMKLPMDVFRDLHAEKISSGEIEIRTLYASPSDAGMREAKNHINARLEDLATANALYGKDQRLSAPEKIERNNREISWLKDLRSILSHPSTDGKGGA